MSKIIADGKFGRFSYFKKIVECNGETYTVSGILKPEFLMKLERFLKYEIMVFDKDKETVYEDYFGEEEYETFMDKCSELALHLEKYI